MTFALLFMALIGGAFLAGIIALAVWSVRRQRRKIDEQVRAAAYFGWLWTPPSAWLSELAAEIYLRGKPVSMVAGPYGGRQICVLDYRYTVSNGDTSSTHTVHLVAIGLASALPPLALTRDYRILGGRDLELENKAFNDQFRISCADDRYASAILHPRVMELMLANSWLNWRIAGNALVSWAPDHWQPAEVVARLDLLCRLADLIPNFVLRDYGHPVW